MMISKSIVPAPRVRARALRSLLHSGVCAACLLLSGAPVLAAASPDPVSDVARPTPAQDGPISPVPGDPRPAPAPERSLPQEPNPAGLQLPDEVTAQELKGEYGLGLGVLIVGGVVIAGAVIGLVSLLLRRSWSETSH